jgi:hypothetical protein
MPEAKLCGDVGLQSDDVGCGVEAWTAADLCAMT